MMQAQQSGNSSVTIDRALSCKPAAISCRQPQVLLPKVHYDASPAVRQLQCYHRQSIELQASGHIMQAAASVATKGTL